MKKENGYQYIWALLINNNRNKINKQLVKYTRSDIISPYFEINETNINEVTFMPDFTHEVKINPFYRYAHIYELLCDPNYVLDERYKELNEGIFNIITHLLGNLDLYEGENIKNIYCRYIVKELSNGVFGENIKKLIRKLNYKGQLEIASIIFESYKENTMLEKLKKGIESLFRDSIVFNVNSSKNIIPIYINDVKNDVNISKVKILKQLFMPLHLKIRVYWEIPFVVLGNIETSKIDNCAIF